MNYPDFDLQKINENIAINTPPIVENNRKERYINEFEERQKMYHSMIEKKAPENIDFVIPGIVKVPSIRSLSLKPTNKPNL